MKVALKPELERLVRERVARGDYASADALVEQAVAQLIEDDDLHGSGATRLRERIERGEREIEAGDFVEYDAESIGDLARDVHQRGLKSLNGG